MVWSGIVAASAAVFLIKKGIGKRQSLLFVEGKKRSQRKRPVQAWKILLKRSFERERLLSSEPAISNPAPKLFVPLPHNPSF